MEEKVSTWDTGDSYQQDSWRSNTTSFNGQRERRCAPKPLSGAEVLSQYEKFTQVHIQKDLSLCSFLFVNKYDTSYDILM